MDFYVTGLPRTRSAWLANMLTTDKSFCFHEHVACDPIPDISRHLQGRGIIAGDAGAAIIKHHARILEQWPDAKWVFVMRPVMESFESHKKAFPQIPATTDDFIKLDAELSAAIIKTPATNALRVRFEDLDKYDICNHIMAHCTGLELPKERLALLNKLRVTTIAEKARAEFSGEVANSIAASIYVPTQLHKEYDAVMTEMCGNNKSALAWIRDWLNIVMTWDHIVDADPIHVEVADQVFEAMLTEWPFNEFWSSQSRLMAAPISNAIAAWRSGNRFKEFDAYTEIPCAVAFCIGGKVLRDKYSKRIRGLALAIMEEDNRKDGQ